MLREARHVSHIEPNRRVCPVANSKILDHTPAQWVIAGLLLEQNSGIPKRHAWAYFQNDCSTASAQLPTTDTNRLPGSSERADTARGKKRKPETTNRHAARWNDWLAG